MKGELGPVGRLHEEGRKPARETPCPNDNQALISILGYSLRAPKCSSVPEFASALRGHDLKGSDLTTSNTRYPDGYLNLPPRQGRIEDSEIAAFDAEIFGLVALHYAVRDFLYGRIDRAIVAGLSLIACAFSLCSFHRVPKAVLLLLVFSFSGSGPGQVEGNPGVDAVAVASPGEISACLDAMSSAAVCSLGPSQQHSCCAAVQYLDSLGCFCDMVFDEISALDPVGLADLRSQMLPMCVPSDAQRTKAAGGCPSMPFLSSCPGGLGLLGKRIASIKKLGDAIERSKFREFRSLEEAVELVAGDPADPYMDEEITGVVRSIGVYPGIESVIEYFSLVFPSMNKGLLERFPGLSHDWAVSNDGSSISFRSESRDSWYGWTVNRTSSDHYEYYFEGCSHTIKDMFLDPDPSIFELALDAMLNRDQWSVEKHLCRNYLEHCSDPSLNVSEFDTEAACVSFQESLPPVSCGEYHVLGEGNSTFCKWKHAFLVPYRPEHHCAHMGTGHLPDDKGMFVCTQDTCSNPELLFTITERNAPAGPCVLDDKSPLLLHLTSLGNSLCGVPARELDELLHDPPTPEGAAMLQSFCRPNGGDECETLRFNLQIELSSLLEDRCEGAPPLSSLPSPHALLRSASDFVAFHELVCLAREGADDAERSICEVCPLGELRRAAEWTKSGGEDRDINKLCRRNLHLACSNIHGRVPGFCPPCFSGVANLSSCLDSVESFWTNHCDSPEASSKPYWFEMDGFEPDLDPDPKPNPDPYPGDSPPSDTTDHDLDSRKVFDFIVVGAGNSGCVVARRLSDAGYSVLLLEEGVDWQKSRDAWETSRKRKQVMPLWDTPMARRFNSMPNKRMLGRPVDMVFGSTIGGTTSINGGLYSRPSQQEFDDNWPEKWKGEDVLPFFKKFENYQAPTDAVKNHGRDGLLTVQAPSHNHTFSQAWLDSAAEAGVDFILDGASGLNNKSGLYRITNTYKNGRRQDAFTAYLLPIMPRDGLEVRSGATVAKILFEDGGDGKRRAVGVVYILQGLARVSVFARREVILTAGWVGSPKLLMLSGVGPRDTLQDLDIDIEVELEGVGKQLVGRPMMNLMFGGQRIAPEEMPWVFDSAEVEAEWARNGTGILDMGISDIYGKERSRINGSNKTDYLMSFSNIVGSFSNGEAPLQLLLSICKVCHPHSTGNITFQSPNPWAQPEVYFDMLGDDRDLDILLACTKKTLSIYKKFPYQGVDLLGLHDMNDDQIRQFLRSRVLFSYHAWGTCRMGDGPLDVVEPDGLRVRGFSNLRVIDGSIMPEGPCSGPMATTYMIAERGAAFILNDVSEEYVPGAHLLDQRKFFLVLSSFFFLAGAILMIILRIKVVHRAKMFSQKLRIASESFKNNQDSITKVFKAMDFGASPSNETEIGGTGESEGGSGSGLSIYFSSITLDRIPTEKRSLFNASGEIKNGELTLLMGTSGAGKSTLLNVLSSRGQHAVVGGALLYTFKQDTADIIASGANPSLHSRVCRDIAYLRQTPDEQIEGLTVYETLVYYYILRVAPSQMNPFEDFSPITKIIFQIGLQGHEHKTAKELSGGQKRRLQIGTTLLDKPLAIFLDEPTSGLDQITSLKIIYLMKQIAQQRSIAVVAAIHHPGRIALQQADSLYLLFNGYGIFQGNYGELEESVSSQETFEPGECPLDFTFHWVGLNSAFRNSLIQKHLSRHYDSVLPKMRNLRMEGNPDSLQISSGAREKVSIFDSTITLLSSYFLSLASPRTTGTKLNNSFRIHAGGIVSLALGIVLSIVAAGILPVQTVGNLASLIGCFIIYISTLIAIYHVTLGLDLVENESKHFTSLIFERLLNPAHAITFWVTQGFLAMLVSTPGFIVFYFGLGFQKENAIDAILIFCIYTLQSITAAQTIQVWFGTPQSAGVFGAYAAVTIMFSGVCITPNQMRQWMEWVKYLSPSFYFVRTMFALELGAGEISNCGENCGFILDSLEYDSTDIMWSFLILFAIYIVEVIVIYLVMRKRKQIMDDSMIVLPLDESCFDEKEISTISIDVNEYDKVNTRNLFSDIRKSIRRRSSRFLPRSSRRLSSLNRIGDPSSLSTTMSKRSSGLILKDSSLSSVKEKWEENTPP